MSKEYQQSGIALEMKESNSGNENTEMFSFGRQKSSIFNYVRPKIDSAKKAAPLRSQSVIESKRKDNFGNWIIKGNQKKYKIAFRDHVDKSKNLCSVYEIKQNKNANAMTIRRVTKRKSKAENEENMSCCCSLF